MWNLVLGLGLVGCSARPITNAEGQSTESGSTGDGDWEGEGDGDGDWEGEGEGDGDECVGNYNCGYYQNCINGQCIPWECIYGDECELFEECGNNFTCVSVGEPPPNCEFALLDIPTELQLGQPALALSFIDLDDDGQDDLVVATETELLLYEFGAGAPTIVPRDPSTLTIDSMVAGHFDDQPGEDLLLLIDATLHRYVSDGAANLVNPTVEPSQSQDSLLAGDFDGQPPTDLLKWGWTSAVLDFGDGSVPVVDDYTEGAAAFPLGSSNPGLLLNTESELSAGNIVIADLFGNFVAEQSGLFIDRSPIAIETPDAAAYVGTRTGNQDPFWSRLKRLDPISGAHTETMLIADIPTLVAADLDGDPYTEIVAGGGLCTIIFDPLGDPCFVAVDLGVGAYYIRELVAGDHDGDGDEEVALRLSSGAQPGDDDDPSDESGDKVFIIDGE